MHTNLQEYEPYTSYEDNLKDAKNDEKISHPPIKQKLIHNT
jgi:hypothetical protein